jgi:hypothetical protein
MIIDCRMRKDRIRSCCDIKHYTPLEASLQCGTMSRIESYL